ncbi:hypothetical protein ORJ66_20950 [Pseudoalteromonas tunicata]|uniref:hypothetical protein n=1 Tax=Pseudoalteromonas tunicata TaxID=314281 RepID=UPI0027401B38|nr:hypothetical protein [Pseudoalteromonas tunicata]MDP5215517.1 hypothetical protein [Pseudoalteromonas tunicata]
MKTIAISEKASFWKITDIKASILAFDKIYIPQGKGNMDRQTLELDLLNKGISLQDVEYLESQGIIQKSPVNTSALVDKALKLIKKYNTQNNGIDLNTKYIFGNILERLVIRELSKDCEDIFLPSSSLAELPTLKNRNTTPEIYSLVIDNMPIISEDVPFDELISFKNEHSKDYQRLLLWATKISDNESEKVRKDELCEMIESFRRHQEIGDIKFRPGKAELIFQGLGIFRDAFTLRFGSVNKTIASIRKAKGELLEHEINNPNRPLSYLIKAQDEFENN